MRLTRMSLYASDLSEAISFSLRGADPEAQYIVRNIVGLDAEEIVPKFYGSSLATKLRYYDFGLKARDIVMRIVLNPNFGIDEGYSDVRDQLYKAISATRTGLIALHFLAGATTVAKISGFITKFESSYFVEVPEVQLTIHCDDPMFKAINPVDLDSSELSPTNPVLIADSLSTAPHGFMMEVTFKANVPSFTIQDVENNPEWKFKITPAGGFVTGDVLYLSSDYSNKALYMVRGGVTTQLMDRIDPTSIWPILFPGANSFWFVDLASINWNLVEFYAAYWGV